MVTTNPEKTREDEIQDAITNARLAIGNCWAFKAHNHINECRKRMQENPASLLVSENARSAQYLLNEAEYYFTISGSNECLKGVHKCQADLIVMGAPIASDNDLDALTIDRHMECIYRARLYGFRVLADDLESLVRKHVVAIAERFNGVASLKREAQEHGAVTLEEDPIRTLRLLGEEALSWALPFIHDGKENEIIGNLIDSAIICAQLINDSETLQKWADIVQRAREKAAKAHGLRK